MTVRERTEQIELRELSPHACPAVRSRGRARQEADHQLQVLAENG